MNTKINQSHDKNNQQTENIKKHLTRGIGNQQSDYKIKTTLYTPITMRYFFSLCAILCAISGLFGKTSAGEPADHQFILCALCMILATAFWYEKHKQNNSQDGAGN